MMYCRSFVLTSDSSNDVIVSLYTILGALSRSLFFLLLTCLPWNIRKSGQYLNYDSIKTLNRIHLFLNGRNLVTLVKALNFVLALEQILDAYLSNLTLLSNVIPRSLTPLLSQTIFLSNFAHIYLFLFPDIKRWHLLVLRFV